MRTVLAVDLLGAMDPETEQETLTVKVVRSPFDAPGARIARPFKLSAAQVPAWNSPDGVKGRGKGLRDALHTHPGVKAVLTSWGQAHLKESCPLYVQLSEAGGEAINWEVLCNMSDDFAALDRRWPIARISDPLNEQSRPPCQLTPTIKVMAIISAVKIADQKQEWQALQEAVVAARESGLDVQLLVLTGDPKLTKIITEQIAADGLATCCSVSGVEQTGSRVVAQVLAWSPNLLHFFCHGFADDFTQYLELGIALDYLGGTDRGSVKLDAKQLQVIASELDNPWCVTLNCCSSAAAEMGVQSLACRVIEAGFPCAVAMVEPVDASDAYEFTRAFYPPLFRALKQASTALQGDRRVPFEWTEAMYAARTAIADLHAINKNCRQWALPALYVRGLEQFYFERADLETNQVNEYRTRSKVVANWLKTAAGGADENTRMTLISSILADIPKSYWPLPDGSYPDGQ